MSDIRPPIDEPELREMLAEAGLAVDDALIASMLAAVQPMRAKLRAAGAKEQSVLLRGARMDARRISGAPPGRVRPSATGRTTSEEPVKLPLRPTLRNLVARLGTLWIAMVMGLFGLMSMGTWFALFFAVIASGLLYIAVTGRGLGGWERPQAVPPGAADRPSRWRKAGSSAGLLVVIAILWFTGIPGLLLVFVQSVFDPRVHQEGDFVSRAAQAVGLLVLFIVVTHVWKQRHRS